jgi:UDP-N-acetylglucosamine/UDP-N-acetylgalactosamine diphosphorylase
MCDVSEEGVPPAVVVLHAKFEAAGQGHVTQGLAALPEAERGAMIAQLEDIDPEHINGLFKRTLEWKPPTGSVFSPLDDVAPLAGTTEERAKWRAAGLEAIAAGKVGTLLLAGGQGSRLGYDHPKGMYDIGLPSGRSLFALQAAKLLKLQQIAAASAGKDSATIYWYIMTSPATDAETRANFVENKHFGLEESQVFFFCQGMLPAVSNEGKILLESASSVCMAPNGNGGLYEGLEKSGALKHMEDHGVEFIPQYCVDNALVKIADPVFVGFCASTGAECGAKVSGRESVSLPVRHTLCRYGVSCREGCACIGSPPCTVHSV